MLPSEGAADTCRFRTYPPPPAVLRFPFLRSSVTVLSIDLFLRCAAVYTSFFCLVAPCPGSVVWHIRHAAGAKGNNSNDANRNANNNDDKRDAGSGQNSFRGKDSSSSDGNSSSSSRSSGRSGRKYLRSDSNRRRSRNRYEEVLRERYGGSSLCGGENKSN